MNFKLINVLHLKWIINIKKWKKSVVDLHPFELFWSPAHLGLLKLKVITGIRTHLQLIKL